jgi:hypothetical protein
MIELIFLTVFSVTILSIYFYDLITNKISKNDTYRDLKFKTIYLYVTSGLLILNKTIEVYQAYFNHK